MDDATLRSELGLAGQLAQGGRWGEALSRVERVVRARPEVGAGWGLMGTVLLQLKRPGEAVGAFREFVARMPGEAHGRVMLVQALTAARQFEEAEVAGRETVAAFPGSVRAWTVWGRARLERGDKPGAAEVWRQGMTRVPAGPVSAEGADLCNAYGCVLMELGRGGEAPAHLRRSVAAAPSHVPFTLNLAMALRQASNLDEAETTLQGLLRRMGVTVPGAEGSGPSRAVVSGNVGSMAMMGGAEMGGAGLGGGVMGGGGVLPGAGGAPSNAMATSPAATQAMRELAAVRGEQGRVRETLAIQRRLMEQSPGDLGAKSDYLLTLQYTEEEGTALRGDEHHRIGEMFTGGVGQTAAGAASASTVQSGRLRVGYLSADFYRHPVAAFAEGLLGAHDRGRVEVFAYHVGRRSDAVTERLRQRVNSWRDVPRGETDDQLADRIRRDGIDVLIDLSGHTGNNRLGVLARRAARVQWHYLGYPGTTGVPGVDGFLTDAVCAGEGNGNVETEWFSERPVKLGRCWCAWTPPVEESAWPVSALPAERNGYVTFGSMHAPKKLTDAVISTWAALLRRLPTARLRIFRLGLEGSVEANLRARLERAGADGSRVDVTGRLGQGATARVTQLRAGGVVGSPPAASDTDGALHLAAYADVDVQLDVFPFSGHTTAVEGMFMGVPTLTLMGREHRGRMVASVLTAMQMRDWIAASPDAYVERAAAVAGDIAGLTTVRAGLRGRLMKSDAGDPVGLARAIEGAMFDWSAGR